RLRYWEVLPVEQPNLREMTVSEILRRWPSTLSVFIDLHMHCIGCPIAIFHTPSDAAAEHGIPLDLLLAELDAAIEGSRVRQARTAAPHQSGTVGAVRGSRASAAPRAPVPRAPKR